MFEDPIAILPISFKQTSNIRSTTPTQFPLLPTPPTVSCQTLINNSTKNRIGGQQGETLIPPQTFDYGNVIAANGEDGIRLEAEANDNVVQGNYIGFSPAPGASLIQRGGNLLDGIWIKNSQRNIIGIEEPPVLLTGNTIAENNGSGFFISRLNAGDARENKIRGNVIGTNHQHGVFIEYGNMNLIGGEFAEAGNAIAFSGIIPNKPGAGRRGVVVAEGVGNKIVRNSIHVNGGRGIALKKAQGINLNDAQLKLWRVGEDSDPDFYEHGKKG